VKTLGDESAVPPPSTGLPSGIVSDMAVTTMIDVLIRKLERYGAISGPERTFLAQAVSRVVEYEPGQNIVNEGSGPAESCLVLDGFAGRIKLLPAGTRQILAFHIPGDFCDLHSFLLKRMDHGIEALSRCKIAKVPHEKIAEITDRFPSLTRALWWDTALDAAIHREWMVGMGRRSAYEQIAHLLCEMLLRLRAVGLVQDDSFDLPLSQEHLGDASGLSVVHVNRTLQALRRGNLVISNGRRITIPDLQALKEAADFDPAYLQMKGGPES
jgi:CRP-like cAMP-binding protein